MKTLTRILPALALALLAGCASTVTVDNNVQAFSSLTALPAQPTYRFERLPSQQEPGQQLLEAMADASLNKAGLRRDDASPRFTVEVTGRVQRILSPWADPWDGWGWGVGWGWGRHGRFGHAGFGGPFMDSPWYHREVGVVVREIGTHKVVFESRATHDGPWMDNAQVFPAMFEAAMQGFPNPPAGARRVDVVAAPPAPAGK